MIVLKNSKELALMRLRIQIAVGIQPLPPPGLRVAGHAAAMRGKQLDDGIGIDPDLAVALLLRFVEDQLQAEMQVDRLDIVDIFLRGIACAAHKADDIPRLHALPDGKSLGIGRVFAKMGIVIIALPVVGADADAPAAVCSPLPGAPAW